MTSDLTNFGRNAIGFHRLFDELNRTFANSAQCSYPPYNVIYLDDYHIVVEMAVAGFKKEEIEIIFHNQQLTVAGKQETSEEDEGRRYEYRGLSKRKFLRVFNVAENVEIRDTELKDGILTINFEAVVPEEQKPQRIEIK